MHSSTKTYKKRQYLKQLGWVLGKYRHSFFEDKIVVFMNDDTGWVCDIYHEEIKMFGNYYEGLERTFPKEFREIVEEEC
jgi:hypothetical protein